MSHAGRDQVKCFAVRKGELKKRIDAYSNHPQFRKLFLKICRANIPTKSFGEVAARIFSGITPLSKGDAYIDPPAGVRFIRSGEINSDGTIISSSDVHISEDIHNGLMKRSQLERGDLLIAIVGATIGASGVYNNKEPANINQAIAAVRLNRNVVIPEFACWYLHTSIGQKFLDYFKRPVARANINLEEIAEIPILVPKLGVQEALVSEMNMARKDRRKKLHHADEFLDSLDEWLIEKLGITPAPLDQRTVFALRLGFLKGRRIDVPAYRPFFAKGHLPKIPLASLSDLANIDSHVIRKPEDENELVPYVGLPECEQTEVREVVMRPYHEVKGRSVVKPGDILFARIEPSIFNKKYVFVEDLKGHEYAYTSTEFYVVTPNHSEADPHYLYTMFFCSFVFNQVKGKTTGSSGRRRLDPELFQSLQFPKPSMKMQQTIATEVRRRRTETRRLRVEAKAEWESAKISFEEKLLGSRV